MLMTLLGGWGEGDVGLGTDCRVFPAGPGWAAGTGQRGFWLLGCLSPGRCGFGGEEPTCGCVDSVLVSGGIGLGSGCGEKLCNLVVRAL